MEQGELAKVILSLFLSFSLITISISFSFLIYNLTILVKKSVKILDQINSVSEIINMASKTLDIAINILRKIK